MLRPGDEAEGGEAASVVRLNPGRWVVEGVGLRDGDGRPMHGDAVGVVDGRIEAVGTAVQVRRRVGRGAERVAAAGATVLPGLVDPHLHVLGMAAREMELDCGAATDVGGLLRAVAARARGLPATAWVRGVGLDERRLGRLPSAAELDCAAAGRPVRLRHRSRHASVLSNAGLARLRGVVPARALRADGLLVGREATVARIVGPLASNALVRGLRRVSAALLRCGITCVGDASPRSPRDREAARALLRAAGFRPRVFGMVAPGAVAPGAGQPGLVKIMVEDDAGGIRPRPATLARLVRESARRGHRVAVHCVGVTTLVASLEAFAALPANVRRGRGHRLEHLGECPPDLVREIARLDLLVVSNPGFLYWRGDAYREEGLVPPEWLYPLGSLARAGVRVAAGSDAPVTPADPWRIMAAARTRRTAAGRVLGARERIGARAAVGLVCRGAADAVGDAGAGRLRVGARADLVVVDRDPVASRADEVAMSRVLLTMVGGAIGWRA